MICDAREDELQSTNRIFTWHGGWRVNGSYCMYCSMRIPCDIVVQCRTRQPSIGISKQILDGYDTTIIG